MEDYHCPRCDSMMNEVCKVCDFHHVPDAKESLQDELIKAQTRVVTLTQAIIDVNHKLQSYGHHIPDALREDILRVIREVI